jgi:TonB family protein
VITNVFSTPAASVAAKPTHNTEIAGFGETTATRDSSRTSKVEVASATGFGDVSGVGDRSTSKTRGGVQGGVVGGFEGGVVGGSRNPTTKGTVTAAGFIASSDAPKAASPATQKELDPGRIEKPVEILAKPRPDYTDEARKMKIEGEVLLRVLFTVSGEVRVLEVTRGLGYGLNENAIRAAQQIRFKPAQRAGQSVDSTAIVHIVFQLAY